MNKKIKDFWNNIDWGHTAIGGGAGALGGLLFNRFLLGNRTWKSHAIASAIGAALGGSGTALYEHLNRMDKKEREKKGLTPERIKELEEFKEKQKNPSPGDKLVSAVDNSMVGRPVGYAAAGRVVGKTIEGAAAKTAGRRSDVVLVPGDKAVPVQYAKMDKLKLFRGSLKDDDIKGLSPFQKAYLLREADRLGIKINQEQLTNPLAFGSVRPLSVSAQRVMLQRLRELSAQKVDTRPEGTVGKNIKDAKDKITQKRDSLARQLEDMEDYRVNTVRREVKDIADARLGNDANKIKAAIAAREKSLSGAKAKGKSIAATISEIADAEKELAAAREAYDDAVRQNKAITAEMRRVRGASTRNKYPKTALGWFKRGLKSALRPKNSLPVIGAGLGAWDTYRVLKEERELKRDLELYRNKYKKD